MTHRVRRLDGAGRSHGRHVRAAGSATGRCALALGLALATGLACTPGDDTALRNAPPSRPRASFVLEPTRLAVGDVVELMLAVVTPPDHVARPWRPPETLPGFQLLDVQPLETSRQPGRWVHRTRVRIRAREVGRFEIPRASVEFEGPDGDVGTLAVDALPLEVVSTLSDHSGRSAPYGVRVLPPRPVAPGRVLAAFAAGAGLALGAVALVWLARRQRRASAPPAAAEPGEPSWNVASASLLAARAIAEEDPLAALDATSRALRRYAVQRFGGDAISRTTEELERATAPFTMTTRWPDLLDQLRRLDALRFRSADPDGRAQLAAAALEAIAAAEEFVKSSIPRELRP